MYFWSSENRRIAGLALGAAKSVYGNGVDPRIEKTFKSANSIRFHVMTSQLGHPDLLVKVTTPSAVQGHLGPGIASLPSISMKLQNAFRASCPDWLIVPRALLSEDLSGILTMEYVPGFNLKHILAGRTPPSDFDVNSIAALCGHALALWHSHGSIGEGDLRLAESGRSADVPSYLDFSVWNIRIPSDMKGIAMLDFPGCEILGSRHRDLASFLHGLLVVAHHPITILRNPNWWNWHEAYRAFLVGYQDASGIRLTSVDLDLISVSLRETVDREIESYRRRPTLRHIVEGTWYSKVKNHVALQPRGLASVLSGGDKL